MESSVENSDVSEISKKSRSLDLQSLYVEKPKVSVVKEAAEGRDLKRKRLLTAENGEFGLGQGKKKRRRRKEVSLSSFEPNKETGQSLYAANDNGISPGAPDSSKLGFKSSGLILYQKNQAKKKNGQVSRDGNSQHLSSLSNISPNLDDNVVPIPKRPRGFVRRKKFQNNLVLKQTGSSSSKRTASPPISSSKVISVAQIVKLTGDSVTPILSSKVKRKVFDDFKETSLSKDNSARCFEAEFGRTVSYHGPTLKRAHRSRGKRQEPALQNRNHAEEVHLSVDNSANICEDLQEDNEENLEQNAARMLSSRFDPSCTGFSSDSKASASQSMNWSSFVPPFGMHFACPRANRSAGSVSTSADSAGRVLRPRKQHREKSLGKRRRRHFYEIYSTDLNAYWVLNRRIKVFWPLDQSWYFGLVNNYDPERKLHHVKYDDRDEEWINLQNESFKLLLLPSEVPGKSGSEKSGLGDKHMNEEKRDTSDADDNCIGGYMESEPIISWLARSTRRVKSSPFDIMKKKKPSYLAKNFVQPMFEDAANPPEACLGVNLYRKDTNKFSSISKVPDKSTGEEMAEKSMMGSTTCSKDRKLTFVYFRRRFHKREQGLGCISEENAGCGSVAGSVTFLPYVVDRTGALEEHNIDLQSSGVKDLRPLNQDMVLWSGENVRLLKLTVPLMKLNQLKLKLSFPQHSVLNFAFGVENFWLYSVLLMLQHGTLMAVWPKVHLEMLFVNNVAGLRFFLFEGCLMQAVAFVCLVLTAFHQPNEYGKFVDQQLPVTSIRFILSGFQGLGKQLVFVVYNFLEVKNSKWLYLDCKLKRHCSVTKQLPLSECTHDNIKGSRKRSRHGIMHMAIPKESAYTYMSHSSSNSDEKHQRLPPFVLSFTAAPTFFLSLHLKLLIEHNVASTSFQHNSVPLLEGPKNCGDCSLVGDYSNQVSEITLENKMSSLKAAAGSVRLSCAKSKGETDALDVCNGDNWIKSSHKCLNGGLNVTGTSIGAHDSQKNESGMQEFVGKSWPSSLGNHSSTDKSEDGCYSCLNGINVEIPPLSLVESEPVDRGTQSAKQSTSYLAWNKTDCTIRSPNPTGPRSTWKRNRHSSGSSLFGYHSNMLRDGKTDFILNGFGNASRKPRSRVSHVLPFGGYDIGSNSRSHHWKGRPFKRIRSDNEKRILDGSRSRQIQPELLSCDANVLFTSGDRGWRECGAHVVLEFVDHKDWRLLVKILETTKYSFKAHQFLQPAMTNRYTHAMMWRGGKDWILEFPDRSQWTLFKEMHEECYNRNIRAASVKNIPIPGVRPIEESDNNATEVPFVRSTLKYFRQVETEVDMAMDPLRVLYDMDSDDEGWFSKHQLISESSQHEISEEMFEMTMDMFEKVAYAQQCDEFTVDEMEELMVGVGPMDVIKAIHEHWRQKRQWKGMPLIRQFQPPLWERYQQQVKDWELAMIKTNISNGCKEMTALVEKPPMFAFCLRPRGLEVHNKGSKQRYQRKFLAGWHNNVLSRDHDDLHDFGRKLNGFAFEEENIVVPGHNHESLDASPWLQTSTRVLSPRDALSTGYLSMSSDGSERNQHRKLHRNKSKKMGTCLSPSDSKMMAVSYNQKITGQRNGACRLNLGLPEWPSQKHYQPEGSHRLRIKHLDGSDFDEFRLRDASSASQHASNMAKLKREKAQRLLYRADLAIHKAVVALLNAEVIKASSESSTDDG
ncbi:hypothetical protein HHK36_014057 [Tetracentron sinense]|uniref:Enhancer of polycomb-like protein n=1 Tax=Tetracentron sinense TaxID=13715 RepID=A0A835DHC6_TETSI|nr:hypothetical protein HHK36_014057 [Tetracentron sinense]